MQFVRTRAQEWPGLAWESDLACVVGDPRVACALLHAQKAAVVGRQLQDHIVWNVLPCPPRHIVDDGWALLHPTQGWSMTLGDKITSSEMSSHSAQAHCKLSEGPPAHTIDTVNGVVDILMIAGPPENKPDMIYEPLYVLPRGLRHIVEYCRTLLHSEKTGWMTCCQPPTIKQMQMKLQNDEAAKIPNPCITPNPSG